MVIYENGNDNVHCNTYDYVYDNVYNVIYDNVYNNLYYNSFDYVCDNVYYVIYDNVCDNLCYDIYGNVVIVARADVCFTEARCLYDHTILRFSIPAIGPPSSEWVSCVKTSTMSDENEKLGTLH